MDEWEHMVSQHGPLVWRIANRMLGNEHDAADCYQNVFIEAFDVSQNKLINNWPGFLTRLTNRRAIDLIRQRATQRKRDIERYSRPTTNEDADRSVDNERRVARLREAITELPAIQADAFCLKYFEDLTYEEIAARLETDTNRVGVLLHRARTKLKKLVFESESDEAPIDEAAIDEAAIDEAAIDEAAIDEAAVEESANEE